MTTAEGSREHPDVEMLVEKRNKDHYTTTPDLTLWERMWYANTTVETVARLSLSIDAIIFAQAMSIALLSASGHTALSHSKHKQQSSLHAHGACKYQGGSGWVVYRDVAHPRPYRLSRRYYWSSRVRKWWLDLIGWNEEEKPIWRVVSNRVLTSRARVK